MVFGVRIQKMVCTFMGKSCKRRRMMKYLRRKNKSIRIGNNLFISITTIIENFNKLLDETDGRNEVPIGILTGSIFYSFHRLGNFIGKKYELVYSLMQHLFIKTLITVKNINYCFYKPILVLIVYAAFCLVTFI